MLKKLRFSSYMLLTATLLLSACSSNSTPADNGNTQGQKGNNAVSEAGGSNAEQEEVFTLKFFDKNFDLPFDTAIAQEITKRTNVKVEMVPTTGNSEEKLNLMLASNDFPDVILMDRSSDLVNKYIAAGALVPLNDLIEEHGPNIKKMYGDVLNKSRYTDGQNYYLNNWYGLDLDPVFGVQMRKDFLKELVDDERIDDPSKPFSSEELYELLTKFKDGIPTIDGKSTIPMTWDWSNFSGVLGTFKGMWGMKTFYEAEDGKLAHDVRDPRYLEMLKYMNRLYREGLVDKEFAANKQETWRQKLANGNVFATVGAYWDTDTPNNILREGADGQSNEDRQLFTYKVVAPGVDPAQTTLGPRSTLGWDAIAITSSNPDPVKTIKFFDFLASEEGQYLLMWGIEGEHWELQDGKHAPINGILEKFQNNRDQARDETGIRRYTWFINNGAGSDGTPYDLTTKYEREAKSLHAYTALADSIWDSSEFDGLSPEGGTAEALILQKYEDVKKTEVTKIVMASSEQEVESLYAGMIKELDKLGAEKLEEVINKKYAERMELWK